MKRLFSLMAAVGLLFAACGSSSGDDHSNMPGMSATATHSVHHSGMPAMGSSGTATNGMSFDQMFIAAMIPHHQSATDMAKVAQEKAEHPKIKQLAQNIISAQEKEIDQMRGWYKEWYGTDQVPEVNEEMMGKMMPGMDMEHMGMEAEDLSNADPFDKAFIDAMIPHHESAIMMAQQAQKSAQEPEIKQLADDIISSQQKEIDEMKQWRKVWFGS